MKIEDIHAFIAFVQLQSTSLAAQHLGISQPAITRRIQNLENDCGIQLFDRHTRPLKLTAKGREIFEQCCVIDREFNILKRLVALKNQDETQLRIGIPNSLSEAGLFSILQELKKDFPAARIEMTTGWGKDLLQQLERRELDGIIATARDHTSLPKNYALKIMGALHIRPMVSKRLAKTGQFSVQEIQELGWILNHQGCGFRQYLTEKIQQLDLGLKLKIEVTGTGLQMDLVSQGLGVGYFAQELVAFHRPGLELTAVDVEGLDLDLMVYNASHGHLSATQQEIFNVMMEQVNQQLHLG